ncbi:PAQR family membrane homeostasis protein TrhA [Micropruina sp.]|uniref:PAQR family membrane homeostasis protein TrhA n=1 Tax=Micropruina sp. TaxID=2737536 RepID=UPI0039E30C7C
MDLSHAPVAKPLMRGWLHLVMTPLALLAGLALVVLAPTVTGRIGGAVWLLAAVELFGVSATYHRGNWGERTGTMLRRLDHANIFVFIAASYTPLALMLLSPSSRTMLLIIIWATAAAGVFFNLVWINSPRWLHTLLYLVMGWAALGWVGEFWANASLPAFVLIALGGLVYSAGAVVYALKRPDPSPRYFGYHEIFHACTIVAAICHFIAIAMVTLG